MNLKSMVLDTKSAWIDYPGLPGFDLELVAQGRDKLISLRKQCVTTKFNRSTRQPEEIVDEKKFVRLFSDTVITNWKGLKFKYLQDLMLVDIGTTNPESELDYDQENAYTLVSNSSSFDTWLNETVFDLDNFRTRAD